MIGIEFRTYDSKKRSTGILVLYLPGILAKSIFDNLLMEYQKFHSIDFSETNIAYQYAPWLDALDIGKN